MIILKEEDYQRFISKQPNKSPACIVSVTTQIPGHSDYMYEAPPGFQFDRYIASLFAKNTLRLERDSIGWTVSVYDDREIDIEKDSPIEVHRGIYL